MAREAERHRILVVEDDASLAASIVKGLKAAGFDVELAAHGDAAIEAHERFSPSLVVLDLMLPGRSGEDLLEHWSGRSSTPVLVLTARTGLDDRLRSFELGAADFLPKPFWMEELLARVRARLRLSVEAPSRRVAFGDVVVDLDARRALVAGVDVPLTPHEFNVLAYLVERPGRALGRGQIADAALSADGQASARTVDSHLARLRKKLGPASSAIETVWGIGYRFVQREADG